MYRDYDLGVVNNPKLQHPFGGDVSSISRCRRHRAFDFLSAAHLRLAEHPEHTSGVAKSSTYIAAETPHCRVRIRPGLQPGIRTALTDNRAGRQRGSDPGSGHPPSQKRIVCWVDLQTPNDWKLGGQARLAKNVASSAYDEKLRIWQKLQGTRAWSYATRFTHNGELRRLGRQWRGVRATGRRGMR